MINPPITNTEVKQRWIEYNSTYSKEIRLIDGKELSLIEIEQWLIDYFHKQKSTYLTSEALRYILLWKYVQSGDEAKKRAEENDEQEDQSHRKLRLSCLLWRLF